MDDVAGFREDRSDDVRPTRVAPSSVALVARRLRSLLAAYLVLTALWSVMGLVLRIAALAPVRRFDEDVVGRLVPRRTDRWNDVAFVVAHGADAWVKIGATAVLALTFWVVWRRWHEVIVVAASLVLEAAVFITVTTIVQRPRPPVTSLEASPVESSFPSGHTAAAAVYSALAVVVFWHTRHRVARAVAVALAVAAPVLVGGARLYQGMHHPSDVAAGAMLGFVTVAVVTIIVGRPDRPAGAAPVGAATTA